MRYQMRYLLASSAILVLISACSDSSPTEPEMPQPALQSSVVFVNPGDLTAHRTMITDLLEQTLRQAREALPLGLVRISVSADASRSIPGWGMGGYAPSSTEIEIVIDPNFPGLAELLPERLPGIAAHELHHAARWAGPGYGSTLLETMVSEGLADHFALELIGGAPPPWTEAFSDSETTRYLNRARPLLDDSTFNFNAWFFGLGTDLPRWTGYTLGFRLVLAYQSRNPGRSAAELVNSSAEIFRPL